jgi:hypothetical protein
MVETDTPKVFATSALGIPRSAAASTLSLRSLEYAFMPALSHGFNTQASRCEVGRVLSVPSNPPLASRRAQVSAPSIDLDRHVGLGHSTIAVTLDTYSHVLPGMGDGLADSMDEALGWQIAVNSAQGFSAAS